MITMLWNKLWGYILGALGAIAFLAGIYLKGRSDQKAKAEIKELQARAKNLVIKKDVNEKVNHLSDADVDASLRKSGWLRD